MMLNMHATPIRIAAPHSLARTCNRSHVKLHTRDAPMRHAGVSTGNGRVFPSMCPHAVIIHLHHLGILV